jgi:hypothetical protein
LKKLISSSDAADILGLSLQGIHYRIKKGQLESLKKDGKTYVYLDQELIQNNKLNHQSTPASSKVKNNQQEEQPEMAQKNNTAISQNQLDQFQQLALKSKDEQIAILKHTIKLIRKQYKSEIGRLDKNHKQTLEVFQSEVELLKSAFSEMKNIYQLEHQSRPSSQKQKRDLSNIQHQYNKPQTTSKMQFMELKDFFIYMKKHNKSDLQIKSIILDRIKKKDKRFIYDKNSKEVLIYKSDFLDLI